MYLSEERSATDELIVGKENGTTILRVIVRHYFAQITEINNKVQELIIIQRPFSFLIESWHCRHHRIHSYGKSCSYKCLNDDIIFRIKMYVHYDDEIKENSKPDGLRWNPKLQIDHDQRKQKIPSWLEDIYVMQQTHSLLLFIIFI